MANVSISDKSFQVILDALLRELDETKRQLDIKTYVCEYYTSSAEKLAKKLGYDTVADALNDGAEEAEE